MNDDIKVTVWCLAYNHEKYIRSTLEGFVSQKTSFKYEVIVHDDASTDKTADIIREYEAKYPDIIKPIYQTENQYQKGVNKIVHFLIPNANGKYIAFCEGDDYWCSPDKLQKQYEIMEKNDKIELCVHKVQTINEDGSINSRVIPDERSQLDESQEISQVLFAEMLFIKTDYAFHTSSYFIKKTLLSSEAMNRLRGKRNGDQIILRAALVYGNVYYIDEALSKYRLFSVGSWTSRSKKNSKDKEMTIGLNNINAEIEVDKITNYKYQKFIAHKVFKTLIIHSNLYGAKKVKPYCEKVEKEYNINMVGSSEIHFKYKLLRYTPFLFDFLVKTKRIIKKYILHK